jgi:hypothetical protein
MNGIYIRTPLRSLLDSERSIPIQAVCENTSANCRNKPIVRRLRNASPEHFLCASSGDRPMTFLLFGVFTPAELIRRQGVAQGKGTVIPDEAKANSAAMSAWIDSNRATKRRQRGRKTAYKSAGSTVPRSTTPAKRSRKRRANGTAATSSPTQPVALLGTPLRIPYGNKEVALKLGARYHAGGWFAPLGLDLSAFSERGWL